MERDMYGRFRSSRRGEPKWLGMAMYAAWTVACWLLFGWAAGVTLLVIAAAVIAWSLLSKKCRDSHERRHLRD